jgi:putative ABC transport system substrate-binding protein
VINRRTFLAGTGAVLLAAPLVGEAQVAGKVSRIGFLQGTQNENAVAFIQALRDAGYVDGRSAIVETRIYGAMIERLPEIAKDLTARKCDVILATGPYAIKSAIQATSTIPIVAIDLESDPVANGWALSLSRPGGNLTGLFLDAPELGGKEIQLLKEAIPTISRVGILWDSGTGDLQFRTTEGAAREAGLTVQSIPIRRVDDVNDGLDRAARNHLNGVIVLSSPLILRERAQIASAALKNRLPTISLFTLFVESGGLMAYGPDLPEMYKRAVTYIDRILKGAKVSDLPIERPSRFRFVINLKTTKALGLTIPPSLLLRADEIIQ